MSTTVDDATDTCGTRRNLTSARVVAATEQLAPLGLGVDAIAWALGVQRKSLLRALKRAGRRDLAHRVSPRTPPRARRRERLNRHGQVMRPRAEIDHARVQLVMSGQRVSDLTVGERRVLVWRLVREEHLSSSQIADRLGMCQRTIDRHRAKLRQYGPPAVDAAALVSVPDLDDEDDESPVEVTGRWVVVHGVRKLVAA